MYWIMLGSGAHEILVSCQFHEVNMINRVGGGFESEAGSSLSDGRVGWNFRHPSLSFFEHDSTENQKPLQSPAVIEFRRA